MKKTLIYVGPLKKTPDNGVAMKNHLFVDRFKEVFDKVIAIDGDKPKKRPWCIAELIIVSLLYRKVSGKLYVNLLGAEFLKMFSVAIGINF